MHSKVLLTVVCVASLLAVNATSAYCQAAPTNFDPDAASLRPEFVFTKSPQTLGDTRSFGVGVGDVDGDGDVDIWMPDFRSYSQLWLNNGDGTFSLSPQAFPTMGVHNFAMRDFNGDTFLDIFCTSEDLPSRIYFNDGSGNFTPGPQTIADPSEQPWGLTAGDVDNDGDIDVIIGSSLGQRLWLNDGSGVFTVSGVTLPGRPYLADVNGDTYLDAFVLVNDQPDELWLNNGSGSFVNTGQALGPNEGYGAPASAVASGDFDGDGDLDLAVGTSPSGVSIWLNQNNTGVFVDAGDHLDPGAIHFLVQSFDADLDGDLDLITASQATGMKLWENTGSASFSLIGPIFGSAPTLSVACTDLDGDSDSDVVVSVMENYGGNPVFFNETVSDRWGTVTDIDGNSYCTVKIGDQEWMAENLKVTHYRDGSPISLVADSLAWVSQTSGSYCNYANNTANASLYGLLYNWYAAADSRELAPQGWRIPSQADWQVLLDFLGSSSVAGRMVKEAGLEHWLPPNSGTNEAGFTALPGGYRGSAFGVFADLGNYATFWTSTPVTGTSALYQSISYDDPAVNSYDSPKFYGFSLRCIKDSVCCEGVRGNVDRYGIVDLMDLSFLIAYLTVPAPYKPILPCDNEANINGAGIIDLADLSLLIAYLTATPRPALPNCP